MKKTSEELKTFLDFIKECQMRYNAAYEVVGREDKRGQDLLHMIEFERSSGERNKLATKLRKSRIERRQNKDIVEELQPVVDFLADRQHKKTIDHMTQLLGAVRKEEGRHENRVYHPRVEKQAGGTDNETGRRNR